jgi:FkbM family methyltransferase
VTLYGQEPEAQLLAAFVRRLEHKEIVDVGAERGAFAEQMLDAGATSVDLIEPEPKNAAALRERFGADGTVRLHECAAGRDDGELLLHVSVSPDGSPISFGHTVLKRADTDEIAWHETVPVPACSLASLVGRGEIPQRVGILKIDTEGNDLAVLEGMGDLEADVVMVEHWENLPHSLGPCPWRLDEIVGALQPRGFTHFAFIGHHSEFVLLEWDGATLETDEMGNLVFLHERVLEQLLVDVVACASALALQSLGVGRMYARAAQERLEVIEKQQIRKNTWRGRS